MFVAGSAAAQKKLDAGIRELIAGLAAGPAVKVLYPTTRRIEARLREREPRAAAAIFVALPGNPGLAEELHRRLMTSKPQIIWRVSPTHPPGDAFGICPMGFQWNR